MSSLTVNLVTNGSKAAGYIAPAILAGKMIGQSAQPENITALLGVKKKRTVPVMKVNGILKPYTSNFVAQGDVEISGNVLEPGEYSTHLEFDIREMEDLFEEAQLSAGMQNTDMPMDFETFLSNHVNKLIAKDIDNLIWNSNTGGTGAMAVIDGLFVKMIADATVLTVDATTITATNIFVELAKAWAATPEDILEEPDVRIFVSPRFKTLHQVALQNKIGGDVSKALVNPFDDNTQLVAVPSFPNDVIVITTVSNLFFATDLKSDFNQYVIKNQMESTLDAKIRFRMDYKLDVNYGFGDQILYYRPD